MSNRERKEQKLRAKLRKKGLSRSEIEKTIQSKRKKAKVAGIVVGVIIGVLVIAVIVCFSVPQIRNSIFNTVNNVIGNKNKSENEMRIEHVEKLVSEEKSDTNKNELEDFIKNQEESKDIIIPDDATEEQKQVLEEKKIYLQIVENVNRLYKQKFFPVSDKYANKVVSTMTGIKNIYEIEDGYVFYVSAISKSGNRYYKSNAFLRVKMAEKFSTFEELNDMLKNKSFCDLLYVFDDYSRCEDINNELFRLYTSRFDDSDSYTFELLDMTTELPIGSDYPPMVSTLFVKEKHNDYVSYVLGNMEYTTESCSTRTYEGLLEKLKERTKGKAFSTGSYSLSDIDLDWEAYKAQNQTIV